MQQASRPKPAGTVDELFKTADADSDGAITTDEFEALFEKMRAARASAIGYDTGSSASESTIGGQLQAQA